MSAPPNHSPQPAGQAMIPPPPAPVPVTFPAIGYAPNVQGEADQESLPLQRVRSFANSVHSTSTAVAVEVPTVDDLTTQLHELKAIVHTIITDVKTIENIRSSIIAAFQADPNELQTLSNLTTQTGQKIVKLSGPLSKISQESERLEQMAQAGEAAVTDIELAHIKEELAVVKVEVNKTMSLIRSLAWDEVENKEQAKARLEQRIKSENPGMDDTRVHATLAQALSGASERVANVDIFSYSGRYVLENPFSELSLLLDAIFNARKERERPRSRALSDATTLVSGAGTIKEYPKLEDVDLESAPFTAGGEPVDPARYKNGGPYGRWAKIRENWKDYAVRAFLVGSVLSIIVAFIIWETLKPQDKDENNKTASNTDWTPGHILP